MSTAPHVDADGDVKLEADGGPEATHRECNGTKSNLSENRACMFRGIN
jgi:hypothetical protein